MYVLFKSLILCISLLFSIYLIFLYAILFLLDIWSWFLLFCHFVEIVTRVSFFPLYLQFDYCQWLESYWLLRQCYIWHYQAVFVWITSELREIYWRRKPFFLSGGYESCKCQNYCIPLTLCYPLSSCMWLIKN